MPYGRPKCFKKMQEMRPPEKFTRCEHINDVVGFKLQSQCDKCRMLRSCLADFIARNYIKENAGGGNGQR